MNQTDTLPAIAEPTSEMLSEIEMEEPTVEIERGLGFTDGFQFGCGFWAAAVAAGVVVLLAAVILLFLLSAVGIQVLG